MIRYIRVPIVVHDDNENACCSTCDGSRVMSCWCTFYDVPLERPNRHKRDDYYHRCKKCKENEIE